MRLQKFCRAFLVFGGIALCGSLASATPISGGVTTVALDSNTLALLQSLFTVGTVPPTMLSTPGGVPTVNFPITGGNTSTGIIEHSGGITLTGTSTPKGVGTEVAAQNFIINLNTAILTGEVLVNGGSPLMDVPLFDIGAGNVLTVDAALGGELVTLFGIPDVTGATIGTATVSPSAAPEPASLAMVGSGIVAAYALVRRKRRAA